MKYFKDILYTVITILLLSQSLLAESVTADEDYYKFAFGGQKMSDKILTFIDKIYTAAVPQGLCGIRKSAWAA